MDIETQIQFIKPIKEVRGSKLTVTMCIYMHARKTNSCISFNHINCTWRP